jgi:N-ethylmaleimide reductase
MSADHLFQSYQLGLLELRNRIVMAPMTRGRATETGAPHELAATYYSQRASAGLIVSEGTNISQQAKGYAFTPGIFADEHEEGWRRVTTAVHEAGGRIFCQLWHVGRISHPSFQPNNMPPVAPSPVQPVGNAFTAAGPLPFITPQALNIQEIAEIVRAYADAAGRAKLAGFDGVELHAANGYLIDQFLRDKTNHRTDSYGGSLDNRVRLLEEVVEALVEVWPAGRVGVRISPSSATNDMADSNPTALFMHAVSKLNAFDLAYLHVIEGETDLTASRQDEVDWIALRRAFKGTYLANNRYDGRGARAAILKGNADLISFARPFIANPDLPARLKLGAPLSTPDARTIYGGGAQGYVDYPKRASEVAPL